MLARPRVFKSRPSVLPVLVVLLATLLSAGAAFAGLPPSAPPQPEIRGQGSGIGDQGSGIGDYSRDQGLGIGKQPVGRPDPRSLIPDPRSKPRLNIAVSTSGATPRKSAPSADLLYDQYDNPGATGITAQNFEPSRDGYDTHAADDFAVPPGETWTVQTVGVAGAYDGGVARSVNVFFYTDDHSSLPGEPVFTATNVLYTPGPNSGDFVIPLSPPAVLPPGTYWLEVQANQDLDPDGQWFWRNRSVTAFRRAAWRNPGGAFGNLCTDWDMRSLSCGIAAAEPDQMFRLTGAINATPAPTFTGTPPTATGTTTPAVSPTATGTHSVPSPVVTSSPMPINTSTPSITPEACGPNSNYAVAPRTGVNLVPGTTLLPDTQCDECVAIINLPFTYTLYGRPFSTAGVGSNGTLAFVHSDNDFVNSCLPTTFGYDHTIFPHWMDLDTRIGVGQDLGIYTSVTGVAPDRVFNVEWRACLFNGGTCGGSVDFEVRLFENQDRFDLVYGQMDTGGRFATVGVERNNSDLSTQYECFEGGLFEGLQLTFTQPQCGTPTVTVTGTPPAVSPTRTPPPATPTPCSVTMTGSIDQGDRTQVGYLFRYSPGYCGFSDSCNPIETTLRHYDAYTFINPYPTSTCLTVNFNGTCQGTDLNSVAYLGEFDPTNLCSNYLSYSATYGTSGSYSFVVPGRAVFVVIVHEITPNAGCSTYTLSITGLACAPSPTGTTTSTPASTPNLTATSTNTPGGTATGTPGHATTTRTTTQTTTPCPVRFADVRSSDYFYEPVRYLYCRGVISGYGDDTFKPYNLTTRGQLCKIVALAEGWALFTPPAPTFQDVPAGHTFYPFIETAYSHGIISGYTCGDACLEFRSGNNVTRGQLCKIIALAEGWLIETPSTPTFRDVPANHTFYAYIETAYTHDIISGYTCGDACLEFHPGDNATRGQICKIMYLAATQP